jgi:hypothetical protein
LKGWRKEGRKGEERKEGIQIKIKMNERKEGRNKTKEGVHNEGRSFGRKGNFGRT